MLISSPEHVNTEPAEMNGDQKRHRLEEEFRIWRSRSKDAYVPLSRIKD
ncbi:hypothetical protein [Methanocalculus sp.]|nr:hypothetical protein [Methanocalculus sp.]MDG6249781.1 hypothetical protein [Methanocalculus sp.]